MKLNSIILILSCLLLIFSCNFSVKKNLSWTHFYIDPSCPGKEWGTGGPAVADFDNDGDMDVAISRRTTMEAYWYERINDSTWNLHTMGMNDGLNNALGATTLDMDGDGWQDVVLNKVWFKNPGSPFNKNNNSWQPCYFEGGGHDIISADINGDGDLDIISYNGDTLAWYDPKEKLHTHLISIHNHDHGGIAPHGAGDIDGDGETDIVIPGFWFKNPGKGTGEWIKNTWPFDEITNASYGRSIRSWIIDINKDGKPDIVYSQCDTGGSHVYWVENKGAGKVWESHELSDPEVLKNDVPGTGSFHSLGVADFDQDGDLDIFGGEQEDPDTYMVADGKLPMKPAGLKERGVIWLNQGVKSMEFIPAVFQINNPGWHEAVITDVDGDGDIDIISKIWNADGLTYHVDYWRNNLKN